ncbi:hypothetical protein Tco_0123869 [Tanacetum coccineum]
MMLDDDCISSGSILKDYDSKELMHFLSIISSNEDGEKGKYLMEVLDKLWDDYISDKITGLCSFNGQNPLFLESFIVIGGWLLIWMTNCTFLMNYSITVKWCASCTNLPNSFAVKQGTSVKLINDIGLKNTVNTDDALLALEVWRRSEKPFRASKSSILSVSSHNDGDPEIFMVVDDPTSMHHAGMGISKAKPVEIGKFLLEDGKGLFAMVFSMEDVIPKQAVVLRVLVAPYSAHVAFPTHAAELHEGALVFSLVC